MLPNVFPAAGDGASGQPWSEGEDAFGPAFTVDEPVSIVSPLVFASPHSGRRYPDGFMEGVSTDLLKLRRIEDAFVDRLLGRVPVSGAPVICALIGRAVVDLNRSEKELDADMYYNAPRNWAGRKSHRVSAGLGCIPRVAWNGTPIYSRKLSANEAEARLEHIHRPYHRALEALLRRAQAMFGKTWLIDCHSMPSDAGGGGRADIVLGNRFGASCDNAITDFVEDWFKKCGYRVERNTPYAGGYATVRHGALATGREALQIEIRRSLYLNEEKVEPHEGLAVLRDRLGELATELRNFTRDALGLPALRPQAPTAEAHTA